MKLLKELIKEFSIFPQAPVSTDDEVEFSINGNDEQGEHNSDDFNNDLGDEFGQNDAQELDNIPTDSQCQCTCPCCSSKNTTPVGDNDLDNSDADFDFDELGNTSLSPEEPAEEEDEFNMQPDAADTTLPPRKKEEFKFL